MSARRRLFALLLALSCLVGSRALAAAERPSPKGPPLAFTVVSELLARLWAALDAGCRMDPSGCAASGNTTPPLDLDSGCRIDPDGCAAPALELDAGCIIDPNGSCLPGQTAH